MPIYTYNEGDHPGQFQGLRVVRKVGDEYRQRYFAFRRDDGEYVSLAEEQALRREAEALDAAWKKDQEKAHGRFLAKATPQQRGRKMPHGTGVRGISAVFLIDKKFRAGRYITYYTPAFRVHGSQEKQIFVKAFRITALGYNTAWKEAVRFYAKSKGLRTWSHLSKRKPAAEIFREVRKRMMAQGHTIPISLLPVD